MSATVTTTVRNLLTDGRYYYSYGIVVPTTASGVRAVSNGQELTVTRSASDSADFEYATVDFAPLHHGNSRTIEWSYTIEGSPVRSADITRVGDGYATFPVSGFGDAGQVTIEVLVPLSMRLAYTDADITFTQSRSGQTATYTADLDTVGDGISAFVSARDPQRADARTVEVDDISLSLLSFPGDDAWATFVEEHITAGLPVQEEIIGTPWPGGLQTIREDVSPTVLGYAWFDPRAEEIVVPETLDASTLFHELGHAWFNGESFYERWLYEGLTESVAHRVLEATGTDGTPRPRPDRNDAAALPLNSWNERDEQSPGYDPAQEDYAYAASAAAVDDLLADLAAKTVATVLSAAVAGESGYERPGSDGAVLTDWRRFLDLVEIRGGNEEAASVMRTWVADPEDAALLDERAEARDVYVQVDQADAGWQPPAGIRGAMTAWRFDDATSALSELGSAPAAAASVQEAAARAEVPVPEAVRDIYEDAEEPGEYAAAEATLARAAETIELVGEVTAAARVDRDPVTELGEALLGVPRVAASARHDLAAGDLDGAAVQSDTAQDRAGYALVAGSAVVVALLVCLAVVVANGYRLARARRVTRHPGRR
ncbi:hypothetical protein [Georgenia alba]|uniref:Peptidase M1 membrane alanine aminopeptidase domain-containing protein n=1 Tax=Georgenia alba TaxID=2233858 RepID=A0ABW2Q4F6_9MICO